MCGIAGWVTGGAAPPPGTMAAMLESLAHRGPDGEGIWRDRTKGGEVCLGHRRLAIIDPSGSAQPMHDPGLGLTLVFNGEIYNFRELRAKLADYGFAFRRDSDTEVLMRAYQCWGRDVVKHLRGMFAFAIWDDRARSLFLARDRFGEKPLFLHQRGRDLFFASEIKALLCLPGLEPEVDLEAVWSYLSWRYVPAPATLFQGIRKLMPSSCATWKNGRLEVQRYWTPPDGRRRPQGLEPRDPVARFLECLEDSVRLQMVSDVPYGAFLSGGLDSSTIVALMRRHSSTVRTFSVGFSDKAYSELPYAAEVARHLGTMHHELEVSENDFVERLAGLVAKRDAPVSEPSDIPFHLLAREASRSVKMVLTGEGSDELLGGYPKHRAERFAAGFQLIPAALRQRLLEPLVSALPYGARRLKTAVKCLNIVDPHERFVRWFGAAGGVDLEQLCALRRPDGSPTVEAPEEGNGVPFDFDSGASPLRRILYFDQTSWLPDNLLERTDRMTMAASIEARVPFLDHRLAEVVSRMPDRFRVRGLHGKWILREAAEGLLPPQILTRPKVGFRVPVNDWFRGSMRDYLLDHLQSASSLTRVYFDATVLDGMIDEHIRGRQNHEKLLWALLNLEIWHRQYPGRPAGERVSGPVTAAA